MPRGTDSKDHPGRRPVDPRITHSQDTDEAPAHGIPRPDPVDSAPAHGIRRPDSTPVYLFPNKSDFVPVPGSFRETKDSEQATRTPSYSGDCANCGATGAGAFTHIGTTQGLDYFQCTGPNCGAQSGQKSN